MVFIGSNIASLRAQRLLSASSSQLGDVYQRLSSGQRINKASDDAAGLAIADKLRAERKTLDIASRNLNDAISSLSIIDGSLGQQTDILIRLKELAEQSANGSLSATQRRSLNNEYQLLTKEFGRVGDSTTFNGIELLRGYRVGNPGRLNFQAGIDGSRNSVLSTDLPESGTMSGVIQLANAITADYDNSGGTPDAGDIAEFLNVQSEDMLYQKFNNSLLRYSVKDSNGRDRILLVGLIKSLDGSGAKNFDVVSFLSNASDPTQFQATTQASNIFLDYNLSGGDGTGRVSFDPATGRIRFGEGAITLSAAELGLSAGITLDFFGALIKNDSSQASMLEFSGVDSKNRALNALDVVSQRLSEISSLRGNLGATQSRVQSALAVTATSSETRAAAESRIRDVDIASESSNLTKLQILQQVGAAVLAQANQQPSLALTLLKLS